MAKYRALTEEELRELEKEFIDYLVVNGITAEDWVKLRDETPEKAEKIYDLFSDVVLESVLRKTEFVELRSRKLLLAYQCLKEKLVLFGMKGGEHTDFTDAAFISNALAHPPEDIEIFTSEKAYQSSREEELFQMLSNGHVIADGRLFKALALAMAEQ